MALPGLLVEYLVTGAMALIWFLPLAEPVLAGSEILTGAGIAVLAPAIYVLGMLVDGLGFYLTSHFPARDLSLKASVRRRAMVDLKGEIDEAKARFGVEGLPFIDGPGRAAKGQIWLALRAPQVLKDVQMRTSRDRIARASIVNFLLIGGSLGWSFWCIDPVKAALSIAACLLAALLTTIIWRYFERESFRFEIRSGIETLKYRKEEGLEP